MLDSIFCPPIRTLDDLSKWAERVLLRDDPDAHACRFILANLPPTRDGATHRLETGGRGSARLQDVLRADLHGEALAVLLANWPVNARTGARSHLGAKAIVRLASGAGAERVVEERAREARARRAEAARRRSALEDDLVLAFPGDSGARERWLVTPHPALGGEMPIKAATASDEGLGDVRALLERMILETLDRFSGAFRLELLPDALATFGRSATMWWAHPLRSGLSVAAHLHRIGVGHVAVVTITVPSSWDSLSGAAGEHCVFAWTVRSDAEAHAAHRELIGLDDAYRAAVGAAKRAGPRDYGPGEELLLEVLLPAARVRARVARAAGERGEEVG